MMPWINSTSKACNGTANFHQRMELELMGHSSRFERPSANGQVEASMPPLSLSLSLTRQLRLGKYVSKGTVTHLNGVLAPKYVRAHFTCLTRGEGMPLSCWLIVDHTSVCLSFIPLNVRFLHQGWRTVGSSAYRKCTFSCLIWFDGLHTTLGKIVETST